MKRAMIQVLAVILGILSVSFLPARGNAQKTKPNASPLSFAGLGTDTEKLQALQSQPIDQASVDVQTVAQFLELQPAQIQALVQLLQGRQSALQPLLQSLTADQQLLSQLLNSGGAPGDIGQLVIQINALEQQVMMAEQSFLASFSSVLDSDQQQRLEAVRLAAQLQPEVPAFQQLALL